MSTIKNKSLEVNRVPLSRMLKSEMADYAERTTQIVEEYSPQSALITEVFGLLQAQKPKIELLRISYGIDTERLRVESLKAEMMLKISALKLKARMLRSSNLALDLSVVEHTIKNHLRYLNKTKNEKELMQKIAGFFDLLDKDAVVFDAFSEFELIGEIDSIKLAYSNVKLASEKRVNLLSKRSKEPTKNIMKALHDAVNNLFKAIEVSHLVGYPLTQEEGDIVSDFSAMINELSQLSDMYNRSINIRMANNQRKLDREKEREEGNKDPQGNEPMATAMHYGFDDEADEFADEDIAPFSVMSDPLDDDDEEDENDEDTANYE